MTQTPMQAEENAARTAELLDMIRETALLLASLVAQLPAAAHCPFLDRVLVVPIETPRSAHIHTLSNDLPIRGVIIAISSGARRLQYSATGDGAAPHSLDTGLTVLFSKHSGQEVVIAGLTCRFVKAGDILAVM